MYTKLNASVSVVLEEAKRDVRTHVLAAKEASQAWFADDASRNDLPIPITPFEDLHLERSLTAQSAAIMG